VLKYLGGLDHASHGEVFGGNVDVSFIFPKAYVAVIPRSVLWLKKHFYDEVPADVKWAVTYQKFCWGCCCI